MFYIVNVFYIVNIFYVAKLFYIIKILYRNDILCFPWERPLTSFAAMSVSLRSLLTVTHCRSKYGFNNVFYLPFSHTEG